MEQKPDYYIEQFWINLKKSMINFYNNKSYKRPINFWSEELNKLQSFKKYDIIEKKIRDYISLYAIDLMKDNNTYNTDILNTNIKRWGKIANKYNFEKDDSIYHNIIFLLLDIYRVIMRDDNIYTKIIFSQIELIIISQDFSSLIDYAIKNKKESILDKINKFTKINDYIKEKYDVIIDKFTSGKKILKLIDNKFTK